MSEQDTKWTLGDEGFVKLYGDRLVGSSIMDEDPVTRWVFFYMLATSNSEGLFHAQTVKRLGQLAGVTEQQAIDAVKALEKDDKDSTTVDPVHGGRRIVRIEGGWLVLNKKKFAEHRSRRQVADAERKARQRARERESND